MHTRTHPLVSPSLGIERHLVSLHFGPLDGGRKAYLQAALHADELPGMLTLYHLRDLLAQAETRGRLLGEIVLVPVANPIGLEQGLLYQGQGRFEMHSAENFNRHFPDLRALLGGDVEQLLNADSTDNTQALRSHLGARLAAEVPHTELEALRLTLTRLAYDADVVLDLHCDDDSIMHLYTETPYARAAEPLARYLGAAATLVTLGQGARPFDEAMSGLWWRLNEELLERYGPRYPIPLACLAVTVELRGRRDVAHAWAEQDAENLFSYLQHAGFIAGEPPAMPPLLRAASPLSGTENLRAPLPGVVCFHKNPGDWVEPGALVAEIVDPLAHQVTPLACQHGGLLYGRVTDRYARRGTVVARLAGPNPVRSGPLLSP